MGSSVGRGAWGAWVIVLVLVVVLVLGTGAMENWSNGAMEF
jgi:hypothetical protein